MTRAEGASREGGVGRWVWLGLRLTVGSGKAGALRTVLMASGAAIGTLVVLAALGGAAAYGKQYDRELARTPSSAKSFEPASGPVTQLTFGGAYDAIDYRRLQRVAVAGATPSSPLVPGITGYPAPGEAIVSPALAELIHTDERARARFPQRIVGLIGTAGLVAPDELFAYVGVAADDAGIVGKSPVTSFHEPSPWTIGPDVGDALTPERVVAGMFALFVLLPFGIFLATCARLSASTRDRRIAALRLLGVSARQAALVNAVETGVVAAVGTLAGYGLFRLLAPISEGWHLGRLHWYGNDLALPVPVVAVVLATTVLYAVATGVLATRPARVAPLRVRRDAPAGRPTGWRLVPLAAGVAACVVATRNAQATAAMPDPAATIAETDYLAFGLGVVLVGLGLPLIVPLLTWTLAGLAGRVPGPVSWQLAAARLRHAPGVAPRLVAALTVAVFATGVASLGTAIALPDHRRATSEPAPDQALRFQLSVADAELASAITEIGGRIIRRSYETVTVAGDQLPVAIMDCASLLVEHTLPAGESCMEGEVYRIGQDWGPVVPAGAVVHGEGWSFPAPERVLHPKPLDDRYHRGLGSLLITPSAPVFGGTPPALDTWADVLVPDRNAGEALAQVVSARSPANFMQGPLRIPNGLDDNIVGALLAAALTISVGLGLAAFVVAAIDRSTERRRENAGLTVVGAPPRVLATSEIGFAALPLAVGLALATAAIIGTSLALAQLLDIDVASAVDVVRPALWLGGGALAIGLLLVMAPALVPRRLTAEMLRRG